MKTKKKNVIATFGISLPKDLMEKADEKAAKNYQCRSEYIRKLIISDLNLASLANKSKKGA